jgi:hypothetical protein
VRAPAESDEDAVSGAPVEDADAWLDDQLTRESDRWEAKEARHERMRLHARPPKDAAPKRRFWGR